MKRYLILGLAVQCFALPSKRLAEQRFQNQNYKKALETWVELLEESPQNALYALKAAELKFLLEGRGPALQLLNEFQKKNQKKLSLKEIQELRKKTQELSRTFWSEEAQTFYLQAVSKANLKDWSASHAAITQALALEPGQIKILELKAEIEKSLGSHSAASETLSQLAVLEPESLIVQEKLIESHVFHGRFQEAKTVLDGLSKKTPLSFRAQLARAVCLWELGKKNESKEIVQHLARSLKSTEASLPAPLLWMLHKIETDKPEPSSEAKAFGKSLKKVSVDEASLLIDGWDPYRLAEYTAALSK